jgi:hypothetical protein
MTDPTELLSKYIQSLNTSVAAAVEQLVSELRQKGVSDEELCRTIGINENMAFNKPL